jgi:hypothetical protein
MSTRRQATATGRWLVIGLLLLAAALVWHDLGTREVLGRDENATITKLDQPDLKSVLDVTYMKVSGEPGNMQPLYFVLQHLFWPVIGRSAFVLRYLSAAAALLAVVLTYKLGEALFWPGGLASVGGSSGLSGQAAGLIGALLTALLPLHLRYAQIARPYTLLAALSLASAYFLVRGLRTNRPAHWIGFVLTATLNFYNHFNAIFVLVVQGIYAGIIWLATLVAVVRRRQSARRLMGPLLGFLVVGLLCAPGLLRLLQLPWVGQEVGAGGGDKVTVELTVPFFRHYLYMSGLKTKPVQNLFFVLTALGILAAMVRRRWHAALFGSLWIAVPFVTLAAMRTPRPFEERYVIFVTPVAFLLIGYGLASVGGWLAALARRWKVRVRGLRWIVTGVFTLGLVGLLLGPLQAYYELNLSAGRLEQALTVVENHARPGDVVVVSPRVFARPLQVSGAEVLYLDRHLPAAELDALDARPGRLWIVHSSFLPPAELQEPLDRWVQAQLDHLVRVPIKAITALSFGVAAPSDPEVVLQERVGILADLAAGSSGNYEAWQRYGLLADAYEALADLYAGRGEDGLAGTYRLKAEEARATAPPP